ncbi:MAG: hypothetical protein KBT01_09435 [Clostridiales bacterium]|nr:hypothetical protein [Candidatus Blautia equi]
MMDKKTFDRGPLPTGYEELFHGLRVRYGEQTVHVVNDQALKAYMGYSLSRALHLAEYLKWKHKKKSGQVLRITTTSLAVELLGHFAIQEGCFLVLKFHKYLPVRKPVKLFCQWLLKHMDVIDCGGMDCDNNRFVWDILSMPVELYKKKKAL